MPCHLFKVIWSCVLVVVLFFNAGDTFGTGNGIKQLSKSYLYSIPRWEMANFLKKWTSNLNRILSDRVSSEEKAANVRRYFDITDEINSVSFRTTSSRFESLDDSNRELVRNRLETLVMHRENLEPEIEETLEAAITSALKTQGVKSSFIGFDLLWPPVDFRLEKMPKLLVISPRDRIATQQTSMLIPNMTPTEREALEAAVAKRNLSALVVSIGGVATYPSLVHEGRSLSSTLRTAVHEWVHHYLAFHPLGRGYYANANMTTLNEAVADIVGNEVGELVWRSYFATPEEASRADFQESTSEDPEEETRFDFNAFMQETRLTTETLLNKGRVNEAEAYMENRRLELTSHNIFIRKINQAFFAFNGNYAIRSGTGSVSPIGSQVTALRNRMSSVGEFLSTVNRFASYESFLRDEVG